METYICSDCGGPYTFDLQTQSGQSPFCPHKLSSGPLPDPPGFGPIIPDPPKEASTYKPLPVPQRSGHPRFYELVEEITDLHNRKNTDYASGTKEGPLGNFERVSTIMKLYPGLDWDSPFGVTLVYMLKQIDAAFTLRSQKRESVVGEGIASRLKDVTVYSLIAQIQVEGRTSKVTVHHCCGCSCMVCENGHQAGQHTKECVDRLLAEAK